MKKTNTIPMHNFSGENDLGQLPLRYELIEVRNEYDFSEPHRHDYYEVFFFTQGGGAHLIDFVQRDIADRSVHLVRPGQVHLLQREPNAYGAVVHFSKDTAIGLQAAFNLLGNVSAPVFVHNAATFATIQILLDLLQAELNSEAHLEIMMSCLSMLLLKSITAEGTPVKELKTKQHFNNFRQLVDAHYRKGHQPEWYAQQLNITEKKLNEACKTATGNTVSNYLKDRILLEAKRLLSHSPGTVKEIGYYLGFEDPVYFTRFFRKNTGITAGDFREKYK